MGLDGWANKGKSAIWTSLGEIKCISGGLVGALGILKSNIMHVRDFRSKETQGLP